MEDRFEDTELVRATIVTAAIHAVAPVFLLAFMACAGPGFTKMFAEMDVEPPTAVKAALKISQFAQSGAFLAISALAILLMADAGIYFLIRRSLGKPAARGWSAAVLSVQIAILIGCAVTVLVPLAGLLRSMGP